MRVQHHRVVFSVFAAGFLAACSLAHAQPTPQQWRQLQQQARQGQQIPRDDLETSGVIKGMAGGAIHLQTTDGEQWQVLVEARPQDVSFTGSAFAGFVRPGMVVSFSAALDKRGEADDPVTAISIVTIREGVPFGVSNDAGGGGAAALFESKPEPAAQPKGKKEPNPVYKVTGQLTKLSRSGEMTINCGNATVKADLAKDAKVAIDVADLSFARVGDKIDVRGWYPKGVKGQAIVNRVSISSATPLGEEPKKRVLPKVEEKTEGDAKAEEK